MLIDKGAELGVCYIQEHLDPINKVKVSSALICAVTEEEVLDPQILCVP
ncbi:MAG: hypothetical protein KDN22_06390 [Verrucomicrobiae bacterium]|nr:hypothetical protein [Verrucomicrobiae bacterium]